MRANGIDIALRRGGRRAAARPAPRRLRLDRAAVGGQPRRLRRPHGRRSPSTSGSSPPTPEAAAPPSHGDGTRVVLGARRRRPRAHRRARPRPAAALRASARAPPPPRSSAIRHPDAVRAVVNHAGYDMLQPARAHLRDGARDVRRQPRSHRGATPTPRNGRSCRRPRCGRSSTLMKADYDERPGRRATGGRTSQQFFDRATQLAGLHLRRPRRRSPRRPCPHRRPRPLLLGRGGGHAYRTLPTAELAILPNHGHLITPAAVAASIEFLERHQSA